MPDDHPFNRQNASMPERYRDFTLCDFYRTFDWGLPIHGYSWYDAKYEDVTLTTKSDGRRTVTTMACPLGELRKVHLLAADGSWAPHEHFVKDLDDLKVTRFIVEHARFEPRYERLEALLEGIGDLGIYDIVIGRSPFGKLIHEYMGFERVVYALHDHEREVLDFLELQERKDLEVLRLAAAAPGEVVILSDHADENLISPPFYRKYCIPHYRKACAILHEAGKYVSTHLDGNFKGFFPFLEETEFDILDGCTPAPMSNYDPEELADALGEGMFAWCGVPATLFCQRLPDEEILRFGERIVRAFGDRVILNVGDILPPDGDIEQVVKLGRWAKEFGG